MNDVILPGPPRLNPYGPLTPSQIFERTFQLLRESPALFFGIALVVIAIEIVFAVLLGGGRRLLGHSGGASAPIATALFVVPLALLGAVVVYVFTQIVQGALFLATRTCLAGASMTVGDACQAAAAHAGRLVGISLLIAVRVIGYMLLLLIPTGLLVGIVAAVAHIPAHVPMSLQAGSASGGAIFAVFLALVFLVIYAIAVFWLAIRYALAIPACLEENLPVTDAIRRSITLSRGSKGRLVVLFIGIAAVWIAISAITVPLQLMAGHAGAGRGIGLVFAADALRILFSWGVITFMGVATTLCYFDLRVRKEGFGAPAVAPVLYPPPIAPTVTPDWPVEDLPIS